VITEDGEMREHVVQGKMFEAPTRFTLLECIGKGAYGIVCSAFDTWTGNYVAVKKIENTFEHVTFAKRTLREVRLLRLLQHENLINAQHVYLASGRDDFQDVYVVSEFMESDLASVIKSSQPLMDEHFMFFLYQIFRGLKYMHSACAIHRDLKPRNLLVNSKCDLKICDFGLARALYPQGVLPTCPMTEYVCTRWYRAPEVLCACEQFDCAIDVWSVGCIFAEMIRRKPLFPGKNTQHQLQFIIGYLGMPSKELFNRIPSAKCRTFIESLPDSGTYPLTEAIPGATPAAYDILSRMLEFSPEKRPTAEQALAHPYLARLTCPVDEPSRTPLDSREFDFDLRETDMEFLREEIYAEALGYNSRYGFLAQQQRETLP